MAWVWSSPSDHLDWDATIDYAASEPLTGIEYLSNSPIQIGQKLPVYKSEESLKRFKHYHCPPFGGEPVVDKVWRDIILSFVPANRVQFQPVRLVAKDGESEEFMWVIPFDRTRCIDTQKSDIIEKIERPDITLIYAVKKFVHKDGCLGIHHLARDEQMEVHLMISEELKEALAGTGEDSMFFRPEDLRSIFAD
jgi:hypothetical protein